MRRDIGDDLSVGYPFHDVSVPLENQTSEQASRILSMQMANDNAIKLLKNLQLEYNKLRQQNITAELMDIVGGAIE